MQTLLTVLPEKTVHLPVMNPIPKSQRIRAVNRGEEAEITRQMMKSSRQCIMLCDSSKLGKKGFARISGMDEVDVLITDSGLPEKTREDLEALGVKVLLV